MIQLTDRHWCHKIPTKVAQVTIDPSCNELMWWSYEGIMDSAPLPSGSWRFLFTSESASEEDARKVVLSSEWHFPERHTRYVDYAYPYDSENKQRWSEGFGTALESLNSLLRSKGCEGIWAVVRKK